MNGLLRRFVTVCLYGLFAFSLSLLPTRLMADSVSEPGTATGEAKQEAAATNQSNQALLDQVSKLSKRVEELETKLSEKAAPASESDRLKLLEDRLSAQEKIASSGPGGGFNLDSLPSASFLKGTKISGFVDTSYTFNFNQPRGLSNNANGIGQLSPGGSTPVPYSPANLHAFDRGSNDFTVNLVQLQLNKDPDPVGYNIKLDYGNDAEVFGAAENFPVASQDVAASGGQFTHGSLFDLEQAYIVYKLPMDKISGRWKCFDGLTGNIQAGKFVTLAGAEVIESKDNWNFSRSFLFGLAIPFTHTGVRTNWNYKGWLDTTFGVNNGWDVLDDNNQAKTLESRVGLTPCDWINGGIVYITGAEQSLDSGNYRHLVDVVTTIKNPWKQIEALNKLTLMFNMDWAQERKVQRFDEGAVGSVTNGEDPLGFGIDPAGGSAANFGNSEGRWHGYAGYAKYDLFPWWTIATRGEYFQDTDGARTLRQQDLWEFTFTNQFNLFSNLITRLEYRHDAADKSIFGKHEAVTPSSDVSGFVSSQDIMYLEAIYSF